MRYGRLFINIVCITTIAFSMLQVAHAWTPTGTDPIVNCGQFVNNKLDECGFDDFVTTAGNVIDLLLWLGTLIAAIVFAIAGFKYMTAGGNPSQISEAHRMFKMVAIGFVIALSAWLIVNSIETALLANPEDSLLTPASP